MSLTVHASCLTDGDTAFLGIRCVPERSPEPVARRAYHLALLLDTSGSMEDHGRIQTVKRTLHILLDVMKSEDQLTLITYNSDAKLLVNARRLTPETKADIHTQIDAIQPAGCTNLERACDVLEGVTAPIHAVFVLTDGHINRGICDATALCGHVCARVAHGTPIYTLGYGVDHNANLLRDIALRSRGSYTFADCDEAIPAIVGTICGGLEHQVGRNAQLSGFAPDWVPMVEGSATIGTLIEDKPVWIVLQGSATASRPDLRFYWTSIDAETETCVDVRIDDSIDAVEIAKQRDRARVAAALSNIVDCLARQAVRDARQHIETCCALLDTSPARRTEFVESLYTQLVTIRTDLDTQARIALPGSPAALAQSPAPMYRMMAQTTVLMTQQGGATGDPVSRTFLSPSQRAVSQQMTQMFTTSDSDFDTPAARVGQI